MSLARALCDATPAELRERLAAGHPIDPGALEGWAFRGTSLGMPRIFERLTWKTFQKTFYRDPASGRLYGWNVRLEQDGVDAPSRPKTRHGTPVTEWHYEVVDPAAVATPPGLAGGLVIDYSTGRQPAGRLMRRVKDPLVALSPGQADTLLGVSYVVVGQRWIETPTWFTLEREHRLDYIPYEQASPPRATLGRRVVRLTSVERRWVEALFETIQPGGEGGLPAFAETDRGAFWRSFEGAAPPEIGAGLRAMLYTLLLLPAVDRRFGRPFLALSPDRRAEFIAAAARDPRYFVRQCVVTLKTLACLAYFDDPRVRAQVDADGYAS